MCANSNTQNSNWVGKYRKDYEWSEEKYRGPFIAYMNCSEIYFLALDFVL